MAGNFTRAAGLTIVLHNVQFEPVEHFVHINGIGPVLLAVTAAEAFIPTAPQQSNGVPVRIVCHNELAAVTMVGKDPARFASPF